VSSVSGCPWPPGGNQILSWEEGPQTSCCGQRALCWCAWILTRLKVGERQNLIFRWAGQPSWESRGPCESVSRCSQPSWKCLLLPI
jgi:hypothetical protein